MLSVMTMALRDAPQGTLAPFAIAQTPEALRQRLFGAYVQAALRRRGKASGGYTPEQTMTWLGWLARRMKEHGHTLFAVEQLQPGWLAGASSQLGYFAVTRLLGSVSLAVPVLLWKTAPANRLACAILSVVVGLVYGGTDFSFLTPAGFREGCGGRGVFGSCWR